MESKKETKISGFTLIELLVVIAIIGLLSSVIIVAMNSARAKARNARRKADIQQVRTALELYYLNNGEYPHNGTVGNPNQESDIQTLSSFLSPSIMPVLPNDPTYTVKNYEYVWKASGGKTDYGILIPFSNDGGTDCQYHTAGGSDSWFSSAPLCNY